MMATKKEVYAILHAAEKRVANKNLPIEVRGRSKETVELYKERIRREGWEAAS